MNKEKGRGKLILIFLPSWEHNFFYELFHKGKDKVKAQGEKRSWFSEYPDEKFEEE